MLSNFSLHQFLIRDGIIQSDTQEFEMYRKLYSAKWGPISRVLRKICKLLREYDIHLGYVDGYRLYNISINEMDVNSINLK